MNLEQNLNLNLFSSMQHLRVKFDELFGTWLKCNIFHKIKLSINSPIFMVTNFCDFL